MCFDKKKRRKTKRFWSWLTAFSKGRTVLSREMVPGDVYEVSDPSLTQVPCDCLLLSGDCIINESMLTGEVPLRSFESLYDLLRYPGESIPVSKLPITDDILCHLDLKATSVHPSMAKHFLFSGTKIIRARKPRDADEEAVALAIVVRTGFSTTKGSLVRSMLFPKPSGFKFYRDSFRYISVMGLVAMFGFTASFVNFVRLGVSNRRPPFSLSIINKTALMACRHCESS
jgi:cation-transporting ATPase 13A2